jgi:hypothetical protein
VIEAPEIAPTARAPPTDAATLVEEHHAHTTLRERARRSEPGHSGADDRDLHSRVAGADDRATEAPHARGVRALVAAFASISGAR